MRNVFDRHITCAFLYSITRYGYPPDAEHMVTYVHEMADLGFQSIELEGIGEAHLKTVYHTVRCSLFLFSGTKGTGRHPLFRRLGRLCNHLLSADQRKPVCRTVFRNSHCKS